MNLRVKVVQFCIARCARCGQHCRRGLCSTCAGVGVFVRHTPFGAKCWAVGPYDSHLKEVIRRLKFHDESIWATHLGGCLAELLPDETKTCILVPVPLHPTRLSDRGYNQAALLAKTVAQCRNQPVDYEVLVRKKATAQQARLAHGERRSNVEDAFRLGVSNVAVRESHVLLVDDVITSGQTIEACSQVLQEAGLIVVGAICAATTAHSLQSLDI